MIKLFGNGGGGGGAGGGRGAFGSASRRAGAIARSNKRINGSKSQGRGRR